MGETDEEVSSSVFVWLPGAMTHAMLEYDQSHARLSSEFHSKVTVGTYSGGAIA
jgi:hypothetical protein